MSARSGRWLVIAGGSVMLAAVTVYLFMAFDRGSHSASDTLRPFLITAVPLWVAGVGLGRVLLRRSR